MWYAGGMDQSLIVTGWVMGVGSLGLLAWALWWDRGRVRCGRCWYDLSGVVGSGDGAQEKRPTQSRPHGEVVCPECGKGHRSRRVYTGDLEFELRGWTIEELRQFVVNGVVPEHAMP